MKISIITVCFNSGQTIGRTLRSVREQSYENYEHIVVDGGSKDATLSVVMAEGPHVLKLISEKDDGIYDAMNKGVRLATGNVIAFLNADDYYKDSEVLKQVAMIMQAENLDALYGDVEFFRFDKPSTIVRRYNSGRFKPSKLGWGWMPAHPGLFISRSLFEHYGLFQKDYLIAGDFEFIVRVFKNTELRHRHIPKALVCMQMGGVSTSGLRATMLLNHEMIRACRVNNVPTNWVKMMVRYPFKLLEYLQIAKRSSI
jgi:glycosyltransferase involved in cell wall biosynthesis